MPGLVPAGAGLLRQDDGPNIITFDAPVPARGPTRALSPWQGDGGHRVHHRPEQTYHGYLQHDGRFKSSMSGAPEWGPARGRLPSASTSRGQSRDGMWTRIW